MAQVLAPLTGLFQEQNHPDLLVGLGTADDAAVYRINASTAVVATLDFFAPLVDDPHTYGAIAAANAMSDVFAMGGEVVLALNIAAFPAELPPETLTAILRGGAEKVAEAGGVIAGGHTVWDDEPKYGLSVLGLVHPRRIFTKAGLRPGDHLFLTKPLGTGIILTAANEISHGPTYLKAAIESMTTLNRHSAHLARAARVSAATDITGFGLAGHLWEMAERSGVAVEVNAAALPLLPGALAASAAGFHTGGEARNRAWLQPHVTVAPHVDPHLAAIAFDPQTSGGLLLAASPRRATALKAAFAAENLPLAPIGRVAPGNPHLTLR